MKVYLGSREVEIQNYLTRFEVNGKPNAVVLILDVKNGQLEECLFSELTTAEDSQETP